MADPTLLCRHDDSSRRQHPTRPKRATDRTAYAPNPPVAPDGHGAPHRGRRARAVRRRHPARSTRQKPSPRRPARPSRHPTATADLRGINRFRQQRGRRPATPRPVVHRPSESGQPPRAAPDQGRAGLADTLAPTLTDRSYPHRPIVNVGTAPDRANVIHSNPQACTGSYPQRWTTRPGQPHRCG